MSRRGECPHGHKLTYTLYSTTDPSFYGWLKSGAPECPLCGLGRFSVGIPFKPGPNTPEAAVASTLLGQPLYPTTPTEESPSDPALDGF